jgi:regulator of sigma E protease
VSWVYTILGFIALIIFHEAGHFAAAKAVGMRVERFCLFFPPILGGITRGETQYAIGAVPLGGYVKITGMTPTDLVSHVPVVEDGPDPLLMSQEQIEAHVPPELLARAFYRQPVWKRVVVIAAGPLVNVVLAFLILFVVYVSSHQRVQGETATVAGLDAGFSQARVLHPGDTVIAIDGHAIQPLFTGDPRQDGAFAAEGFVSPAAAGSLIGRHTCADGVKRAGCLATTPVRLTVMRGSRIIDLSARPRYDPAAGGTRVGFQFGVALERDTVGQGVTDSLHEMWSVVSQTVSKVAQIFTSAKARSQLHGIVGTSSALSAAFSYGTAEAFGLIALISLSLAVINLFPFLPLDGGHIFWALAEKVRGRRIPFSVMEKASMAGVALVLVLFVIGLTNDIHTLSNGGFGLH